MLLIRFTVYPVMPTTNLQDSQSDRAVLSRPSLVLVTWLLDSSLDNVTKVTLEEFVTFNLNLNLADYRVPPGGCPCRLCSAQHSRSRPENVEPADPPTADDQRLRNVPQHPGTRL